MPSSTALLTVLCLILGAHPVISGRYSRSLADDGANARKEPSTITKFVYKSCSQSLQLPTSGWILTNGSSVAFAFSSMSHSPSSDPTLHSTASSIATANEITTLMVPTSSSTSSAVDSAISSDASSYVTPLSTGSVQATTESSSSTTQYTLSSSTTPASTSSQYQIATSMSAVPSLYSPAYTPPACPLDDGAVYTDTDGSQYLIVCG